MSHLHLRWHSSLTLEGRFGLADRGLVRAGLAADLVVFDPDTISDRSTYDDGKALAVGVEHVLVNGVPVLLDGDRKARDLRRVCDLLGSHDASAQDVDVERRVIDAICLGQETDDDP